MGPLMYKLVVALAFGGWVVCSCRGRESTGKGGAYYGYIVLPKIVEKYGLTPGDTLPELRPTQVSDSLRSLTDTRGHPVGTNLGPFDRGCIRYFGSISGPLILGYALRCPGPSQAPSDNFVPVVILRNGEGLLRPVPGELMHPKVFPYARTADGTPIYLNSRDSTFK